MSKRLKDSIGSNGGIRWNHLGKQTLLDRLQDNYEGKGYPFCEDVFKRNKKLVGNFSRLGQEIKKSRCIDYRNNVSGRVIFSGESLRLLLDSITELRASVHEKFVHGLAISLLQRRTAQKYMKNEFSNAVLWMIEDTMMCEFYLKGKEKPWFVIHIHDNKRTRVDNLVLSSDRYERYSGESVLKMLEKFFQVLVDLSVDDLDQTIKIEA